MTAEETVHELVALDLWSLATNGTQEGQARKLAHIGSNLADTCSHRRHYRSFAWNASMAPQDEAQEVQVWTSTDSVGTDYPHIFDKQQLRLPERVKQKRFERCSGTSLPSTSRRPISSRQVSVPSEWSWCVMARWLTVSTVLFSQSRTTTIIVANGFMASSRVIQTMHQYSRWYGSCWRYSYL